MFYNINGELKMKLIICDTYSQLIEAIQMKITLFKDDVVDI